MTDDGAIVKPLEFGRQTAFLEEFLFAGIAPRLQIIWVGTVPDKTDGSFRFAQHVLANDGGNPFAMGFTADFRRSGGHGVVPIDNRS
jgi:hypothetical protein